MKPILLNTILAAAWLLGSPGIVLAGPVEQKGTDPYVTHFIFRPLQTLDVSGVGTATLLEAVGTTENMKGEKMFDKMSARCTALSIDSGGKKYIDGACVLADKDGDKIFSTFDTRDVDKSQPDMSCGTHLITGGTGKYAGITGSEPFACNPMPALAGEGGYTAMDIPHNTTWEIKSASNAQDARDATAMAALKDQTAKLGAPKIEGKDLYFGSTKMNNSTVVDEVAKEGGEGMAATLFVKDGDEYTRVATTIPKAIGTALTGPALNLIKAGKPYYGEADVLGTPYVSDYEPIKDASGAIIGIYFVGHKKM